ncbi:hypothetical protein K2W90_01075 [Candidatus Babeliales bacterium]|nr:hypothetical protein [Candidatus Babeliales bacterium]
MSTKAPSSKTIPAMQASTYNHFAEVIQSSLETFTAQCWSWNFFPNFGSLVQVESNEHIILGCVVQIQTGSMDPMRYPFPYQKTEEELLAEQPQIFEFLKTTFDVQILGYADKENLEKVLYALPPKPSKIHAFVKECAPELSAQFLSNPIFLPMLFSFQHKISNLDELLLAILHNLTTQKKLTQKVFHDFCQTFSLLSGNDYRRLKLFLKRVEHIINN